MHGDRCGGSGFVAVEEFCKDILGEESSTIDDDIGLLVKRELPAKAQKALDIVRGVGKNAVHPGQIDLKGNHTVAGSLFAMINAAACSMRRIEFPNRNSQRRRDLLERVGRGAVFPVFDAANVALL